MDKPPFEFDVIGSNPDGPLEPQALISLIRALWCQGEVTVRGGALLLAFLNEQLSRAIDSGRIHHLLAGHVLRDSTPPHLRSLIDECEAEDFMDALTKIVTEHGDKIIKARTGSKSNILPALEAVREALKESIESGQMANACHEKYQELMSAKIQEIEEAVNNNNEEKS